MRSLGNLTAMLALAACARGAPDARGETAVATAAVRPAAADSCLAGAPLAIAGVALEAPDSAVRAALGPPSDSARGMTEDDGGTVPVVTYRYAALEVDVVRGVVDRVRTTGRAVEGPLGIRPAMRTDSALARLRARGVRRDATRDTVEVAHCGGASFLVLATDRSGRVVSVEIVAERP